MQQATISNSATSRLSRNHLNDILQRVGLYEDMVRVEQELIARIESRTAVLRAAGAYTVQSGGKRLRVMLVLLAARLATY